MAKKILVVDDEKPISDIIKFNLEKEGYEVVVAYDGEEALEKVACNFMHIRFLVAFAFVNKTHSVTKFFEYIYLIVEASFAGRYKSIFVPG